jgi:hypothetical protein
MFLLARKASLALVIALFALACDAKSESNVPSTGAPSASAVDRPKLPEMAAFSMTTSNKFKTKVSFQAPKDAKEARKTRITWKSMTIRLFAPLRPVVDNDGMFRAMAKASRDGAVPKRANEGDLLITHWDRPDGLGGAVCGVKGEKPLLILAFEPEDEPVALAICRSMTVQG